MFVFGTGKRPVDPRKDHLILTVKHRSRVLGEVLVGPLESAVPLGPVRRARWFPLLGKGLAKGNPTHRSQDEDPRASTRRNRHGEIELLLQWGCQRTPLLPSVEHRNREIVRGEKAAAAAATLLAEWHADALDDGAGGADAAVAGRRGDRGGRGGRGGGRASSADGAGDGRFVLTSLDGAGGMQEAMRRAWADGALHLNARGEFVDLSAPRRALLRQHRLRGGHRRESLGADEADVADAGAAATQGLRAALQRADHRRTGRLPLLQFRELLRDRGVPLPREALDALMPGMGAI